MDYYSAIKWEKTTNTHKIIDEPQNYYAEQEGRQKCTYFMILFTLHSRKEQNSIIVTEIRFLVAWSGEQDNFIG